MSAQVVKKSSKRTARMQAPPGMKTTQPEDAKRKPVFFLFPIILDMKALKCDIHRFLAALGAEGAPCGPVLWPQSYKEDVYRLGVGQGRAEFPFRSKEYTDPDAVRYKDIRLPNAAKYQENTFFTVCHPRLEPEHMRLIAAAIKKVLAAYGK
jgi:dTDP-4-amino-4,6-dideoxygalactose transaminase